MVAGRYGTVRTLRKRSEFLLVQSTGRRARGRHLVVLALPREDATARLGLTVSKRVGNAVVRNRVRRRLREIVRTGGAVLPEGHDVVVVAYPSASAADSRLLARELAQCFSRLARGDGGRRG